MPEHITKLKLSMFRGFRSLELDGLRSINLIVGRTSAGKTSLLEALMLACDARRSGVLPGLFRANSGQVDRRYFRWLLNDKGASAEITTVFDSGRSATLTLDRNGKVAGFPIAGNPPLYGHESAEPVVVPWRIVSVQARDPKSLVLSFGQAVRKREGEVLVQDVLQRVDKRIARIRVDVDDDGEHIMVDVGLSESVPLAQVGQGIYRLVAILSDIIGSGCSVCLIDEVENGIHHTALTDVFRGLSLAAKKAGVQLFLTTHSFECIEAAHEAMADEENYDLSLVQLFRVSEGRVQGRVLQRKEIETALAGGIDVRS